MDRGGGTADRGGERGVFEFSGGDPPVAEDGRVGDQIEEFGRRISPDHRPRGDPGEKRPAQPFRGFFEFAAQPEAFANALNERIAAFNDRMREGIKGGNDGPGTGYVQGNFGGVNKVKAGVSGLFLNYSGEGTVSDKSSHSITYTTSHDNYTLWDQLVATTVSEKTPTMYTERNSVIEKKNMMAAALTLTSRGRSFLLAGEEIARTKYGNHNSYNAQDKVNAFDYSRQEQFSRLFNWYQGLIQLRKNFPSMQYGTTPVDIWTFGEESCIGYIFTKESDYDKYQKVMVMYNPYGTTRTLTVEGEWKVLANSDSFDFNSTNTVSGTITLPSYGTAILVQ